VEKVELEDLAHHAATRNKHKPDAPKYSNDDPRKKQPVCHKLAGMLTRTKHAEHMQDNV
jgi:hypothetical protein